MVSRTNRVTVTASGNRAFRTPVLAIAAALGLTIGFGFTGCGKSGDNRSGELVVASYGGAWQEAQKAAMFEPFAKTQSAKVKDVVYDGQYARIAEMVKAGKVEWDVVDAEGNMVIRGAKDGILEPIDYNIVKRDDLIPGVVNSHGVGIVAWSWVLAYNKGALTEEQLKTPWKVFFDPKAVPGARGLRNDPRRTLEIALLADGVPAANLYPLDVDRAFRVLTQFRDRMRASGHAIVWWDEYAQPPQLLRDKEVVLTPAANGRVADAQKEGAPIDFTWSQGIIDLDWWIVPRGTPNRELAMRFIAFASSPDAQAEAVRRIPYGPVSKAALARLPSDIASRLPTYPANLEKQLMFNTQWWADHLDQIQERWNQWRTSS